MEKFTQLFAIIIKVSVFCASKVEEDRMDKEGATKKNVYAKVTNVLSSSAFWTQ